MKKIIYPMLIGLFIGFSAFTALSTWKVKEPYEVKFAGGKVHGEFKGLKASIQFDKSHPEEAKISASIDVSTVATGFFLKNSHVKDALDADDHPIISFTSTSVTKNGSAFDANGKLTMKGVTKTMTIHFTFDENNAGGTFKGGFRFIPKDFGITHDGTPDDLSISLLVPVTK